MPDFGRWNANGGDPSLNEINRSDQFLDALATQQPVYATDRGEAELAQLLSGWRDDVRETPMDHVATPQAAAAALNRTTSPAPRSRFSLAIVGSVAAAMLAIGGFGAVVAGSGPGDSLYGLRTMLFGEQEQTRDDAVILAAQTEMQQVQQLIEQGDWQGAQAKLEAVTTTVATVGDLETKQELVTQWQELTVRVEAQNPTATLPPDVPLPTFPDVPVVVLDPGTSSETTTAPSATDTTTSVSAPSSTNTTPASPETTTSVGATSPAPSSSPSPLPTSTAYPSPTPSASPSSVPPSTTTTRAPLPTSTTVVMQSTTVTQAPLPTSTRAPLPTSTVAAPLPTSTVAAPLPTPTAIPTPTAAPTQQVPPTTTTLIVVPEAPETFEQPR